MAEDEALRLPPHTTLSSVSNDLSCWLLLVSMVAAMRLSSEPTTAIDDARPNDDEAASGERCCCLWLLVS